MALSQLRPPFALTGLVLLAALSSGAASASVPEGHVFAVPRSQLTLPDGVGNRAAEPTVAAALGLAAGAPSGFTLPSRIPTASFAGAGLPGVFATAFLPVPGTRVLRVTLGAGFLTLRRQAERDALAVFANLSQNVAILSGRMGLELMPPQAWLAPARAYAAVALLPSLALTADSPIAEGTSYTGLPLELSLGTLLPLSNVGLPWTRTEFDLAARRTLGRIGGGSFAGWGMSAGVRVHL